MKNKCLFSSFEVTIKICKIQPPDLVIFIAFRSADIIFHKLLKLHLTLTEENIFITNFPVDTHLVF